MAGPCTIQCTITDGNLGLVGSQGLYNLNGVCLPAASCNPAYPNTPLSSSNPSRQSLPFSAPAPSSNPDPGRTGPLFPDKTASYIILILIALVIGFSLR